jgi:flagellar protein FliS
VEPSIRSLRLGDILKLGDIRARSRSVSKAMAIVTELSLSLNHTVGGDLSKNLAELYAYTEKLLIQGNQEQSDPPLAEAERLLSTLLEGWPSENQVAQNGMVNGQSIPSIPLS